MLSDCAKDTQPYGSCVLYQNDSICLPLACFMNTLPFSDDGISSRQLDLQQSKKPGQGGGFWPA
jgi:hypothetical protein